MSVYFSVFFVPDKKYFAGNYGFTLKKIDSVVVVLVVVLVMVVSNSQVSMGA